MVQRKFEPDITTAGQASLRQGVESAAIAEVADVRRLVSAAANVVDTLDARGSSASALRRHAQRLQDSKECRDFLTTIYGGCGRDAGHGYNEGGITIDRG